MNTRELLTMLKGGNICTGFSEPVLISLLNQAISILGKQAHSNFIALDPDTGQPPILETTAGTYHYTAPTDTWVYNTDAVIWNVENILLRYTYRDNYDYDFDSIDRADSVIENNYQYIELGGRYYLPYYQCQTMPADDGARIIFSVDPGDTTDKYYVQGYVAPPTINTDRDPLPIPDIRGTHMEILLPAVERLAEARNNGNMMEAIQHLEKTLRPLLTQRLRLGTSGDRNRVTLRFP
ncbi:MAG: hypothetical protein ACOC4Y_02220 [bacterium]